MNGADPPRSRGGFRFWAWGASAVCLAAAQPARCAAIAAAAALPLTPADLHPLPGGTLELRPPLPSGQRFLRVHDR